MQELLKNAHPNDCAQIVEFVYIEHYVTTI